MVVRAFAIACLFVVAACGNVSAPEVAQAPSEKMERLVSAYVSQPENGRYQTKHYPESGRQVTAEVVAAFAAYLGNIRRGSVVEDREVALATARRLDSEYLIYPEILHWEDRATEWSMISDKLSLRLTVIKTSDGRQIASAVLRGNSAIATFGGDHPQDMLPNLLKPYVAGLF